MQTEALIATLLAAAAFLKHPVQDLVTQSIKDAYGAAKAYLRDKLIPNADAVDALEMATEKPESFVRRARLADAIDGADLGEDEALARLIRQLAGLVPASLPSPSIDVQVSGRDNHVQVAGRDLINTTRHIRRNAITPDERHLTVEERTQVREVTAEVAARLADGSGNPNFAGAHRMLQKRFNVASYLLLKREQFAEAIAFLKQRRAAFRSHLQRRAPTAYRNDYFRAVFSAARELKWDGQRVYQFAAEVLRLEASLSTLKEFGPIQLKALAEAMRGQVARVRKPEQGAGAPIS